MDVRIINRINYFVNSHTDQCLPYRYLDSEGYGHIQIRVNGIKKHFRAHRMVYSFISGEDLNTEDVIMHSCDNPSCCNPRHLSKGTNKDNSDDKVKKGRQASGNKNGRYRNGMFTKEAKASRINNPKIKRIGVRSKISLEIATDIKIRLKKGEAVSKIADIHSISRTYVSDIKRGRSFNNLILPSV